MAGKLGNLLDRDGRYYPRLMIPLKLRPFMSGKCDLRTARGGDCRAALKALPRAIVELRHQLILGRTTLRVG